LRDLPSSTFLNRLFDLVRVQLSTGAVFKSKQNRNVPAVGHVAGGSAAQSAVGAPNTDTNPALPAPAPLAPNIELLETRVTSISFSVGSFVHAVGAHAPANGAGRLAVFRNQPVAARPIGASGTVQASVKFTPRSEGEPVNVVTAWWFGGTAQETTIAPGQARELLVVAENETGNYAVDARRLSRHESSPLYIELVAKEYDVDIQLIADGMLISAHRLHYVSSHDPNSSFTAR
jgi:hypothetical protein